MKNKYTRARVPERSPRREERKADKEKKNITDHDLANESMTAARRTTPFDWWGYNPTDG